jgi:hypothetical protein
MNPPHSRGFRARAAPLVTLAACLILPLAAPAAAGPPDLDLDHGPRMERLIQRYAADEDALRRFYDRPLSDLRRGRLLAFVEDWTQRLAFLNFDTLAPAARIDYLLLRNHLSRRYAEYWLQHARNVECWMLLPFAPALLDLETARRSLEPCDPEVTAAVLAEATTAVGRIRPRVERGLEEGTPGDTVTTTPAIAWRAAQALDDLRGMLKAWFAYRDGYEPDFGWWVRSPYAALDKALKDYGKFLRERVAGVKDAETAPLLGDPIGRAALERALAQELVPYGPEQLIAIAESELAWCEREGIKAAADLRVEGGWKAAVEHVKGLHVPPGEQDDLVARQAVDAIRFLDENDLVTIPDLCRETWRLDMISEKGQKTLPFAVYAGQLMKVAYATEDMDHEAKLMSMRGNNEHFTRIVTPHELIPGHHLQLFMAKRHRPYRAIFRTPFFVEGWALHWEMLLWDLGYARTAQDRVGMLFWRMHRCARIIVTLKFHLGEMEPPAMVDFLVDRVGLEKDGATGEVRRYVAGAYGPLYQCAYMLGGLQLRALHRELVGGGTMSQRAFHDAVLRQGPIPFELVRAALTRQALGRDHEANWAFYGPVTVDERK